AADGMGETGAPSTDTGSSGGGEDTGTDGAALSDDESTGSVPDEQDPERVGTNDGGSSEGGSGSSDGSTGEVACDITCGDLARDAMSECPQLADGSPDKECISSGMPEAC